MTKEEAKGLMKELCDPADDDGFMPFKRKSFMTSQKLGSNSKDVIASELTSEYHDTLLWMFIFCICIWFAHLYFCKKKKRIFSWAWQALFVAKCPVIFIRSSRSHFFKDFLRTSSWTRKKWQQRLWMRPNSFWKYLAWSSFEKEIS